VLRRIAVRLAKDALRLRYHGKPVPLGAFVRLRRFAGRPNAVTYRVLGRPHDARDVLRNGFLSERLAGVELGNWTLSGATLNVLVTEIQHRRPGLVLEFGSGVSTACLARYTHEAHGDKRLRVVSIEDGEEFAAETERRLEELGLAGVARVFQAPLAEQTHRGLTLVGYTLPEELTDLLRQRPPDLVLIDGPGTGPTGSRYSSLVAVRPFLRPSTPFFLDDALEDYGLLVGEWFSELDNVRIDGILPVGHGLLVGRIEAR
jgi:hypothetical protein